MLAGGYFTKSSAIVPRGAYNDGGGPTGAVREGGFKRPAAAEHASDLVVNGAGKGEVGLVT